MAESLGITSAVTTVATTTTGKIDFHDPLFISPSDSPNLDLVSETLKGSDNYKIWSREMCVALEAKNKLGFITGECENPGEESPNFALWKRCNALVKSWITRSLSRELVHGVVYYETASLIWKDLKERFDKVNGARIFFLYKQINSLNQGTNSVTEYYSHLRELWDEYESLIPAPSKTVTSEYQEDTQQLKMMTFLMGLNECYHQTRSQILMMTPLPSHSQAFSIVCNEEGQRSIGSSTSLQEITILAAKTVNETEKGKLKCEVCNYTSHTKDTCYRVVGYPPGRGRGRKGGKQGGRGYQGRGRNDYRANQTYSDSSLTENTSRDNSHQLMSTPSHFTESQFKQILQLIGDTGDESTKNNNHHVMTAAGETNLCSQSKTWKILSYNVWFREDLEMHNRMRALGNLIELHSPDVICFQEVTPNLYEIFQRSNWWKGYRCSIPNSTAFPGGYFCMQLSKLPVKSYTCRPFHNSIMGRELCIAEVKVTQNTSLFVATSHLESPCPSPPTWNQMFSKERVEQANEAVKFLEKKRNAIFCGDMNWDDETDGPFPLSDGWIDAWTEMRPGEVGFTYDTKSNKMISGNRALQKRLDRFVCKLNDFKISGIEMIGMDEIPGLSYVKEKRVKGQVKELVLPVLPSDHYGLLLTISPGDSA